MTVLNRDALVPDASAPDAPVRAASARDATTPAAGGPVNAFCVDLEEWFHVCGVETPYADPAAWGAAPRRVEPNTERLLDLLGEAGVRGTFLTLGWIADEYPALVRRIAALGHEVGCHGYHHRLVYEQRPEEFRAEVRAARARLRDLSGQEVGCFRAPSFSIRADTPWAHEILAAEGFSVDVSVVPTRRANGGIAGSGRAPARLATPSGEIRVFPMSVMRVAGRAVQFSGGGYLRALPMAVVRAGFRQNHRLDLPVMTYIHPREVDPHDPHLPLPPTRRFRHRVGMRGCEGKLRALLGHYRFGTVADALGDYDRRTAAIPARA